MGLRTKTFFLATALIWSNSSSKLLACSPSSASLQFAADDKVDFYLNGTALSSCNTCWGFVNTYTFSGSTLALLNSSGDNVLAAYATDTGGNVSGLTWLLTINYSDCPTQYLRSNNSCTVSLYAGNAVSGSPPVTYPPGWNTVAYSDGAWLGVYSSGSLPGGAGWASIGDPLGGSVPWAWGVNSFGVVAKGDGYFFRQHFSLGSAACPISLPASPTPYASPTFSLTLTKSPSPTVSPTPSFSATNTPCIGCTATPTPSACSPSLVAGSASKYAGNTNAVSVAYSSGAGTSTLLLLQIVCDAGVNISSISDGGFGLSRAVRTTGNLGYDVEIWYLASPPSGSNTIAVNWGGAYYNYNMAIETFSGVNQSTPIGAMASLINSSCPSSFSSSLTTLAANSLVSNFLTIGTLPSWTPGAGQHLEFSQPTGNPNQMYGDYLGATSIGSYSMSYSSYSYCVNTFSEMVEIEGAPCLPPSPTASSTATPSPTKTPPYSPSNTPSPTRTITPEMPLTKTSNVSVATIGDTLIYCLTWGNDSSATVSYALWDTVPPELTYQGCNLGCTQSGGLVNWNFSAPAGSSGTVCFWGVVSSYPP